MGHDPWSDKTRSNSQQKLEVMTSLHAAAASEASAATKTLTCQTNARFSHITERSDWADWADWANLAEVEVRSLVWEQK